MYIGVPSVAASGIYYRIVDTCRIKIWDITSSERETPNHEHQLKPRLSASICAQDYTPLSRHSRVYPEFRCSGPTSNMPVPFEALLPYAIMIGMFGVTGTGLSFIKTWRNEGKAPRWSLDQWDR
ncbi:hypothetical protein E4U27_001619 [Claviceps purpurea]|nr:hypothetical protein E4U27_001619 [Claviceps purpurea]